MTKKLFVKSYGCQMNAHDAERMAEILAGQGYEATDRAEDADMVLLNTCHIRERAAEKVYSDIGRLRPLREGKPGLTIAVAGCVAQAEGAEILARAPAVNLVVGPQSYQNLPALLDRVRRGEKVVETEFPAEDKFARLPARRTKAPAAFLTVQEGCDKFCSFCVVPYTRGAEVSRPMARILEEARGLVAQGVREITLLGQNVNAWHGGEGGFAALLHALAAIEGLERLRYTTSHPNDMDEALIAAHGEIGKLMPFLHLPVQSGSDRVLKAMNRRHRATDYLRLVARLRVAQPDLALSSDFIVGFPGETEEDFQATLALVEEVRFVSAFTFAYSPRPGTPAAERPQVDPAEAHDRLLRLQAVIERQQRAAQDAMVGRRVEVLFEKPGRQPGQMTGKSPHLMAVAVMGPDSLRGRIMPVRITASLTNSLAGEVAA